MTATDPKDADGGIVPVETVRVVARWDYNEDEWYFQAADEDEVNAPQDGQFVFNASAECWSARMGAHATWMSTYNQLVDEATLLTDYPALDQPCSTFVGSASDEEMAQWNRCEACGRHRRYHEADPDPSAGPVAPSPSLVAWASGEPS